MGTVLKIGLLNAQGVISCLILVNISRILFVTIVRSAMMSNRIRDLPDDAFLLVKYADESEWQESIDFFLTSKKNDIPPYPPQVTRGVRDDQ